MTAPLGARLPKTLRRRAALEATARWSFLGEPLRDGMPEKWPEGIALREEPEGGYVYRERTAEQVPVPRCRCGGLKSAHRTDRRGRHTCFHSPVCGCSSYRPEDAR